MEFWLALPLRLEGNCSCSSSLSVSPSIQLAPVNHLRRRSRPMMVPRRRRRRCLNSAKNTFSFAAAALKFPSFTHSLFQGEPRLAHASPRWHFMGYTWLDSALRSPRTAVRAARRRLSFIRCSRKRRIRLRQRWSSWWWSVGAARGETSAAQAGSRTYVAHLYPLYKIYRSSPPSFRESPRRPDTSTIHSFKIFSFSPKNLTAALLRPTDRLNERVSEWVSDWDSAVLKKYVFSLSLCVPLSEKRTAAEKVATEEMMMIAATNVSSTTHSLTHTVYGTRRGEDGRSSTDLD